MTIATESIFSELAAVTRIANGPLFALDCTTTLTCNAVLRSGVYADLRSEASQTTINDTLRLAESNISAEATLTLPEAVKYRPGSSNMLAVATVFCEPRIDTEARAALTTTSTLSFGNGNLRVRYNSAAFALVTTQTSTAIATKRTPISLQSQATLAGFGTNVVNFTIALTAFNTQLTVGSVFRIDPYYELLIKAETRLLKILPESRLLSIESETRGLKIKPESRVLDIEQDTRTITIRGYIE